MKKTNSNKWKIRRGVEKSMDVVKTLKMNIRHVKRMDEFTWCLRVSKCQDGERAGKRYC